MNMKRRFYSTMIAILLPSIAGPFLPAQGPGDPMPNFPFSSFRFNFINPGSRATGMGQAFIALSDDATGSETNPAGLTALIKPQIFIEGRGIGNDFYTLEGPEYHNRYSTHGSTTFSPAFLSVVIPRRNWAFAVYRQELARYSVAPWQPQVVLPEAVYQLGSQTPVTILEFSSRIKIRADNYGLSVARRWGEKINLGLSLRACRLGQDTAEYQNPGTLGYFFRIPEGDTEAVMMRMKGACWGFSWTAGVIIKPLDWLKTGGVYRSGSRHRIPLVFDENVISRITGLPVRSEIPDFSIQIPDRFGWGVAIVPNSRLTFTCDVVRIEYGDMTRGFVNYIQTEFQDDYRYDSGTEFHLGGEYTLFIGNTPFSLRGGFYTDPDNTLHFAGDPLQNDVFHLAPSVSLPPDQVISNFSSLQNALFPRRGTDYHATGGMGLTLRGHLQLDAAFDLSRDTGQFVISMLYNF